MVSLAMVELDMLGPPRLPEEPEEYNLIINIALPLLHSIFFSSQEKKNVELLADTVQSL